MLHDPHVITSPDSLVRSLRQIVSLLLPTLVVVLGVVGVAWAAVSGSGIVDGSITGRDIKSNSVPGLDIRNGTVSRGDLEPAERSDVIERLLTRSVAIMAGSEMTILSQEVPRGRWKVSLSVEVVNADPGDRPVRCSLAKGASVLATRYTTLDDSASILGQHVFDMETAVSLGSAGTLTARCWSDGNVMVGNAQIIAERVGSLTKTGSWQIAN